MKRTKRDDFEAKTIGNYTVSHGEFNENLHIICWFVCVFNPETKKIYRLKRVHFRATSLRLFDRLTTVDQIKRFILDQLIGYQGGTEQ
jgi:hypothetical protein